MDIDPLKDPYILEGRVVTLGPLGVIEQGAIYISQGRIAAVQSVEQPGPAGFENAPRVRTGDSIYPGLIELHNHLSYNAMPLWDVPQKYTNNGQWRGIEPYKRQITKPAQVLGGTEGVVEALVRFVEMRALLGGVTTTQGIALSSEPGIPKFYKGIVRNVEHPLDPNLPAAGTRIANPDVGKAADYLRTLNKNTCYLQHLSEGTDNTARGWFLRLQLENGDWAINPAFCGIHSSALKAEDFRVIAEHGGSMVWSPLSNYLLYGATADLAAVKAAAIQVGLGSDWAPSGSKNLLRELKVAWLANQQQGNVYSAEEMVAMATINPARIAGWDQHLGSIEAGKLADLVAINGQQGDDYMRLIEARETSITLTIIDGVPRVGQKRLMKMFGPGTETISIGRSQRVLNLQQADADELVSKLSLTQAVERLRDAMANLPQLAARLDNAIDTGLFGGSADAEGARWQVHFDFVDEDNALELAQGISAQPYSAYVTEPMALEDITVADDREHLRKLVRARNLPEFVKVGLPPLYGENIPLPEAGHFLQETEQPLAPELLTTTRDLAEFLRISGELTLAERKRIVEQAMLIIEENYVHLPLKRAMHAVDPIQRLRLLRYRLDEAVEGNLGPEIEFHNELSHIFNSLRDLHTRYRLPAPFLGKTAWLPFLIEEIHESGRRKYIVSKLLADAGPASFRVGVTVTHWNGTPIHQAILRNAERHAGSNEAARMARGLNSLCLRPLEHGLPPEDEWVTLRYLDAQGNAQEWTQPWLMFSPTLGANRLAKDAALKEACALGLDDHTDTIGQIKKILFTPPAMEQGEALARTRGPVRKAGVAGEIETRMPGIFLAREVSRDNKKYGYIRLFSFNVSDADVFVAEFARLAQQMPDNGLIIDVRGNGGGLIYAAEQLLQVLTPAAIEPERAQFINSTTNLCICRNHKKSNHFPGLELGDWINSIHQSVETGATFSLGYPITDPKKCNNLGQRYFGPVVLIVDPLCYSATDIFAAGFKDHDIGPILGVGENTGAGGANVWSHSLLMKLMEPDQETQITSPYKSLPLGADIRVAIRRTVRVGKNAGNVVEDLGVKPDRVYNMTRRDVLEGNEDLISAAVQLLAGKKPHTLDIVLERNHNGQPHIKIKTRNVDRVDVTLGSNQIRSRYPQNGLCFIELHEELGDTSVATLNIVVKGYKDEQLVVRRCEELTLNAPQNTRAGSSHEPIV